MAPQRQTGPRRGLRPPPQYLSRSVQQPLLVLVGLLLLVLVLMRMAAQPRNWAWMWGQREGQQAAESGPEATRRDPPALPQHSGSPSVTDRLASPAPTEPTAENRQAEPSGPPLPPGVDGEGLSSIRDDTFFRAAEHEAWFHLFAWLQTTSEQQLETVVQANVSSLQLLRQMPAYRGRLVRVQGVVRRAGPIAAPDNEAGIRSYWQCWLQDAAGTAPIVVYALQMPAGFPRGQALRETAEFTGVAYKRWAYQAESGLLVAPVLLAKTARWTPHPPPPARRPVTPTQLLLGTVCAALLAGLAVRFLFRSSLRRSLGSRGLDRAHRLVLLLLVGGLSGLPIQRAWGQPPADGLQETLRLYGLDESRWRSFRDGQPLGGEELETLSRVLYVLPRLETLDVWRWQQVPTQGSDLAEHPEAARGRLFDVGGEVVAWQTMELPAEAASRFNYTKFYRVTLQSSSDPHPRIVYTRELPERWRSRQPTGDAASASCPGLFLKVGAGDPGVETLLFATARVAWHPQRADPSAGVSEGMALLGSAGMDVGLLSGVVQGRPLGYEDRECFYQMLWAASRIDPIELPATAARPIDIEPLLRQPDAVAGQLLTVSGNARRALRIEVTDADVRERFGIDHYYEMELFLTLEQPVKLIDPHDGESRVYRTFPITICVRQLPPELPLGPEIQHNVQVTGWFMKLWGYRSQFMQGPPDGPAADSARRRQISPLLIGVRVQSAERPPPPRRQFGLMLALGFLAALVAIGLVACWYRRGDRGFRAWKRRTSPAPLNPTPVGDRESEPRDPVT